MQDGSFFLGLFSNRISLVFLYFVRLFPDAIKGIRSDLI